MAGRTRFDISVTGRLIIRADNPARLAARISNSGVSLLLTSGKPAVSESADLGDCRNFAIISRQPSNGSSCVDPLHGISQVVLSTVPIFVIIVVFPSGKIFQPKSIGNKGNKRLLKNIC
jgi:hypothetical protein